MRWFACLLLMGAIGAVSAGTVLEDDFEARNAATNIPDGWKIYRTVRGGKSGVILSGSVAGRAAVVMEDDGPGEIGFCRVFKAKPGQYWYASLRAALPPGAKANRAFVLQIMFLGAKHRGQAVRLDVSKAQYETFEVTAKAPEGTKEVVCHIYSHKDPVGKVAVRDFVMKVSDKPFTVKTPPVSAASRNFIVLPAVKAKLNTDNVEATKTGVIIKASGKSAVGKIGAAPDLVFPVRVAKPGLYVIITETSVDKEGAELMRKARSKFDSMAAQFQIDEARPTERYIFVPWSAPGFCRQTPGKFVFNGKDQQLKIWLPEHCELKRVCITPYTPFPVPKEAQNYKPRFVPPKTRPRIWVNAESLPAVRARLTHPEHQVYWDSVRESALKPFDFNPDPNKEMKFNSTLETIAVRKAFYYLMTGDEKIGREAIKLTRQYMELVEFGNLLDITREIGRAIHSASCVYDWCYGLMTPEDRESIRKNLMRLAIDMECSWPPFRQGIVNGHGNELQINRDLLSMGIALYDEDPLPYQYCSYLVLEKLVPMRKFEYQSPRHNQGVSYGSFRFPCDLRSATLFREMLGKPVFDENIKNVPLFWFYMRTPNGDMFRDGDGWSSGRYWVSPDLIFMSHAYARNPLYKGEMQRQIRGRYNDWVLYLLLDDPEVKAEPSLDSLPLTIDFGPVLSGMIARTGWKIGRFSSDVAAEIKGGGYHFGNHQHADAGSFQIFYRGLLASKLGVYHFYGTPYDMNFAKRSVAQPMMLVRDPSEHFLWTEANDGGSIFFQSHPGTPEQAKKLFRYGEKLYCSFGPSAMRPYFSSYAADLTGAYTGKIKKFVRTFHFFNMARPDVPAVIVMTDDLTTSDPEFRKYWQINTLQKPKLTADGAVLTSGGGAQTGKLYLSMPVPAKRKVEVLSGDASNNVFGKQYTPPVRSKTSPVAYGHRIMFSPEKAAAHDRFLVVMQVADGTAEPLPVRRSETPVSYVLEFGGRAVSLNMGTEFIDKPFTMTVTASGESQILAAGLAAGPWTVRGPKGAFSTQVAAGKNTIFLVGPAGDYTFAPGTASGAKALPDYAELEPPVEKAAAAGAVIWNGKPLPGIRTHIDNRQALVPGEAFLRHFGATDITAGEGFLKAKIKGGQAVFYLNSGDATYNGYKVSFGGETKIVKGVWHVPLVTAAALLGMDVQFDEITGSALLTPRPATLANVLNVSSKVNPNLDQLYRMLQPRPQPEGYWDGEGLGVGFEITLLKPQTIDGVSIAFFSGTMRKAKFEIEVSDGSAWKKVFAGESSGKTEDFEDFRFPAATVRKVRFVGYGNTMNQWNSIIGFKLLEKK